VDDARRVAQQPDIDHWVFSFTNDFDRHVVDPYVAAHAAGRTPNPCIECNRRLKFDRLLRRADQLGFDAIATGHHARIARRDGALRLRRGADRAKDQSYVLYMLGQSQLARCLFPVGDLTKAEVRARAADGGLRTANKVDSQDVCFVLASGGREAFLAPRLPLHPGRLVDTVGHPAGAVDAVELVTVGQRRGLGSAGGERRYALAVDIATATVTVGSLEDLLVDHVQLAEVVWTGDPPAGSVLAQCSAHGHPVVATFDGECVSFAERQRAVAPGQSVVLYDGDDVLGGGIAM
jgi:tRNA-specific 2-thiouridylase